MRRSPPGCSEASPLPRPIFAHAAPSPRSPTRARSKGRRPIHAPAPISGDLYAYDEALTEGCYGYVFVAQDGAGFEHTFPTYGSLQAKIDADGNVLLNDEACPIWVPQRQDLSCVTSPQECASGDTRPCYTGLYGTQDRGVCTVGEESCNNGRWSGSCDGEVTPEDEDTCGDGQDNDCDGGVDEGCEMPGEDMGGTPDMGTGEEDMGAGADMDSGEADMNGGGADMGGAWRYRGGAPGEERRRSLGVWFSGPDTR